MKNSRPPHQFPLTWFLFPGGNIFQLLAVSFYIHLHISKDHSCAVVRDVCRIRHDLLAFCHGRLWVQPSSTISHPPTRISPYPSSPSVFIIRFNSRNSVAMTMSVLPAETCTVSWLYFLSSATIYFVSSYKNGFVCSFSGIPCIAGWPCRSGRWVPRWSLHSGNLLPITCLPGFLSRSVAPV